jgi:hypothetical protein
VFAAVVAEAVAVENGTLLAMALVAVLPDML